MQRVLGVFLLVLAISSTAWAAGKLSGRRGPGFSLPDVNFKQNDLQDFAGSVVILNVMRTGCAHCTEFSKSLEAAQKKYGSRVKVLSIVNPPDTMASVKQYQAAQGLTTSFLFDCGQVAASYLKVTPQNPSFSVPHFFVIDPKGQIREDYGYDAMHKNIFEGDGIGKIIEKYLPAAAASTP
jgi:peroxiredoxin